MLTNLSRSPPLPGLSLDGVGNIYGAILTGGTYNGGELFRPSGNNYDALYDFCFHTAQSNCKSGSWPGPITLASSGTLFGTTAYGGLHAQGVVYKLTP